jgi:ribonucleoside-triphosphate reductase
LQKKWNKIQKNKEAALMKVIKRDGRAVEFDRNKIEIAIEKANKEVREKDRATKDEIKSIINYVMDLDRKRILVEDIQDIIEEQLMDLKHFELAKKYMIYRYTRALVRKANSTDQSILGLIKNQNVDLSKPGQTTVTASIQRDLIA